MRAKAPLISLVRGLSSSASTCEILDSGWYNTRSCSGTGDLRSLLGVSLSDIFCLLGSCCISTLPLGGEILLFVADWEIAAGEGRITLRAADVGLGDKEERRFRLMTGSSTMCQFV